jgi:hypothetical protein
VSSRQPRGGGNDNRAKVKNDRSGISPNTFEPLSLSKAVLKAAAREVSNGSNCDIAVCRNQDFRAFSLSALMLETACEQFEVLQLLLKNEIKVISNDPADVRKHIKFLRAPHGINMALAKSFVANVIGARRICEHGSQHLAIERTLRRQFLSSARAGVIC